MEDELREGWLPHPFNNVHVQALITHNPATVTQWISDIDAYLSLPTVEPKIVYLVVLPEGLSGIPRVLQILVQRHCLFFHLVHAPPEMPDSLRQFLANGLYTFVGGNINSDILRLYFNCEIGGNDTQRLELSPLDQNFTSCRGPLQFLATDWTAERLGDHVIRFYVFEGFAAYLITLATYRVTVSICTAFLVVLAAIRNACEQLASLN